MDVFLWFLGCGFLLFLLALVVVSGVSYLLVGGIKLE